MLSEEVLYQLLDIMPVARLGLLDGVGLPEAMPIVFARVSDGLFSPIDGKPKSSAKLARIKLIENQPKGTLLLDHYHDNWEQLWWVKMDIEATVISMEHNLWDQAVAAQAVLGDAPLGLVVPNRICVSIYTTASWPTTTRTTRPAESSS